MDIYIVIIIIIHHFFNNGLYNNFINIKITEFDGITLWTDSHNDTPNDYILCLTFELME